MSINCRESMDKNITDYFSLVHNVKCDDVKIKSFDMFHKDGDVISCDVILDLYLNGEVVDSLEWLLALPKEAENLEDARGCIYTLMELFLLKRKCPKDLSKHKIYTSLSDDFKGKINSCLSNKGILHCKEIDDKLVYEEGIIHD